ncbi:hypothetical protein [Nocardia australiensis]|uniref:hypothetical protein n=1 Tax=Nocardia australiensis TaxID=2887191 RepID=UPI001D154E9C|nr:hypothetical protein [Nocardia australiensis]
MRGHYPYSDEPDFNGDYRNSDNIRAGAVFEVPRKAPYVKMLLGPDLLPTEITFGRHWKSEYSASQYGESIMAAFRFSVYEMALHFAEIGERPVSSVPSLREITPTLLRTRSYDEYNECFGRLLGEGEYAANSPWLNDFDEPTMTVTASGSGLKSITIDPAWAVNAEPFAITQDILGCVESIRSMKPTLSRDEYLDRESDAELMSRLVRHGYQLMENDN